MANTKNHANLPDQKIFALIIGLCEEVKATNSTIDAANLLASLLTPQEIRMIAIRLRIREMLENNSGYMDIRAELGVSLGTISRVKLGLEHLDKRPRSDRSAREDSSVITRNKNNNRSLGLSGPMTKYSSSGWPVQLLASAIREIIEKTRPP
jgi:uncharacterized protein YerC